MVAAVYKENAEFFHYFDSEEKAIEFAAKAPIERRGFVIVTETDKKSFCTGIIDKQPCWGQLRKYKKEDHPDGCTQPNNDKPHDLHKTLPQGTPIYLRTSDFLREYNTKDDFFKFLLSSESPYRKGFGPKGLVYNKGFEITDMDFDPTVFVYMLRTIYSMAGSNQGLKNSKDYQELPDIYKAWICHNTHVYHSAGTRMPGGGKMSFNSFIAGGTWDHTGGSFKDKYDYNRTNIDYVFYRENDQRKIYFSKFVREKFSQGFKMGQIKEIIEELGENA